MSAIFGILDLEGRAIDLDWIKSMQLDLAHRGPDGQGLYQEPSLVLGHMLLQVTPESVYDKSPYEENGLLITANARLDERNTLMDRLNIDQAERGETTDAILLLRSYCKWGKDFVKDIYGDFSFAIWDKKKKELFCARDHMGVKPFLYYFQDNRFVFSTELKAIVKLSFVNTSIDHSQLRDQVLCIFNMPNRTAWKNIVRLSAASTLSFAGSNIVINQYWKPRYKRNLNFKTAEYSGKGLREILERTIADHTRVIGSVGIPLSGGLDSGTIACLAAKQLALKGKRLKTTSSVLNPQFREPDIKDEKEYIQAVLEQEKNIDATFIYNTDLDFLGNLDEKFNRHYTTVNYSYYVDEALYNQFKFQSVRRVLSGYLGDMTTSNRTISPLPHLFLSGRFSSFFKLGRSIKKKTGKGLFYHIVQNIVKPVLPMFLLKLGVKIKGNIMPWDIDILPLNLNDEERKILQKRTTNNYKNYLIEPFDLTDHFWNPLIENFEEDWDCGSSHHQIEMTYPLLDRRVIEFLLQVPVEHFYADGLKRGLIKKAMEGVLPEKIRNRVDKQAYSPDFHHIFQKSVFNIQPLLSEKLNSNMKNMIDNAKMNIQLENIAKSKTYSSFGANYWAILTMSIWIAFNNWSVNNKK